MSIIYFVHGVPVLSIIPQRLLKDFSKPEFGFGHSHLIFVNFGMPLNYPEEQKGPTENDGGRDCVVHLLPQEVF